MSVLLTRELENRLDELPALLDAIESLATTHSWSDQFRTHVLLVVEELVVNVISYGGRGTDDGWVKVEMEDGGDSLMITISDNGKAFDPFAQADVPDIDLDLDSREIGGWGVHFVREMTDAQLYERIGESNRVSLRKRWDSA